jgi:hypothetical protein
MTAERIVDAFLPLEEAFQRLIDDLETLPADLDENSDTEDPFFDERERVIGTVVAVVRFMQALPELAGKERERPLVTLLSALQDVHEGRNSPLLTPVWKLEEALQHLIDGFERIAALPLETGGEDPVADERAKTMLELVAVGKFMNEVEELKGKGRRLVTLLAALIDRHNGLNPKLFEKPESKSKQGKPKPEFSVQRHRARAAAALEFCIRADPAPRPNVTERGQFHQSCARLSKFSGCANARRPHWHREKTGA